MQIMKAKSQWWVYFVCCADNSFYTGITTDLIRRVRQHNGELVGGARYTRARQPVSLAYAVKSDTRSSASALEYKLRKLPKATKLTLVEQYQQEQQEKVHGSETTEA
jgi:putative endonuclease